VHRLGKHDGAVNRGLSYRDQVIDLEPLKFLAFTERYEALLTDAQEVASLRGESSNQLLETLEEWNDYLERYPLLVLQERPP
jgi:hypothetical protein